MNDELKFYGAGAYLYGALYLIGVFVLGLATDNHAAALLAVVAAGVSYLSQIATAFRIAGAISTGVSMLVWLCAAVVGLIAGSALLIGG